MQTKVVIKVKVNKKTYGTTHKFSAAMTAMLPEKTLVARAMSSFTNKLHNELK